MDSYLVWHLNTSSRRMSLSKSESPRGGGYSLCDGWYICAAVLTPFFHFGRIEHDLFGVLFLIHQQQSYLLGYKNYQFLQKSIFLAPNSIFSSIFLGPIFSGQRHTPISFQTEYPPRGVTRLPSLSHPPLSMWRHRVTCLPPKNASAPWGGPGSRWQTIIVRQVNYIQYLLTCQ